MLKKIRRIACREKEIGKASAGQSRVSSPPGKPSRRSWTFFYVELGGFDTHGDYRDQVATKYKDIDVALSTFVAEMKAQGVWVQVAVQSLSEFGRTITTNGVGTDHAWGGNHFLIGVKGGAIHGQFPELRSDGPQSVTARGQMLLTSPWEAIWKPLSVWLGVEEGQLGTVMSTLKAFKAEHLPRQQNVFLDR